MARRIRRHANPFHATNQVGPLDRMAVFGREAPLEVDIGCGGAGFLFERAKNHPEVDFVGFEVRLPVVQEAMARRDRLGLKNVVIYYANAHENLQGLVPPGVIRAFYVQFPDPCFKKRHHKRRMLKPVVVRRMAELLPMGGYVYAQSDVKPLAEEMYEFLSAEVALKSTLDPILTVPSPIDERTEWERHHEKNEEPIYRMWFEKVAEPSGPIPELEFRDTNPRRVEG